MRDVFDILYNNVFKLFVNLVEIFDIVFIVVMDGGFMCNFVYK